PIGRTIQQHQPGETDMSQYLLIENKGEAPESAFTILGASNKSDMDIPGLIGRFGSGAALGTVTLLRQGVAPTIFCGKTRMDFFTEGLRVVDVAQNESYYDQIGIQYG